MKTTATIFTKMVKKIYLLFLLSILSLNLFCQTNWTRHPGNPVLTPGSPGEWDEAWVSYPQVIYYDNIYHMWHVGSRADTTRIGHATSPDGITWTKDANNPVLDVGPEGAWDDHNAYAGSVLLVDSVFHMWYNGQTTSIGVDNNKIGHATSPDGITWTKDPNNPVLTTGPSGAWDDTWSCYCNVVHTDGTFHMWYCGYDGSTGIRMGHATSPDGVDWTKDPLNPVMTSSEEWEASIVFSGPTIYDGSIFHMWYSAGHSYELDIGYATSEDGLQWEKYGQPVLEKGPAGSWESRWVGGGSVLFDSTKNAYKMWYTGTSTSGGSGADGSIGYAEAPVDRIILVPADSSTIQAAINGASDGDTVLVAEGTYYENINFKGKAITVASQFLMDGDASHISATVIDGSQPVDPDLGSVVTMNSGEDSTSVLCGFTITGGAGTKADWRNDMRIGGGILILGSGGKCVSNIITGNNITTDKIGNGGGILCDLFSSKNFVLRNNIIKENKIQAAWCGYGGGLELWCGYEEGGLAILEGNTFTSNSLLSSNGDVGGGGMRIWLLLPTCSYDVFVRNNRIEYNEISGRIYDPYAYGAGMHIFYRAENIETVIMDNCPTPIIQNNIIRNNDSEFVGGGIAVTTGKNFHPDSEIKPQPVLVNNTIVDNISPTAAGMFVYDSHPFLMNNIFWNDLSADGCTEFDMRDLVRPTFDGNAPHPENVGQITAVFNDIQGGWEGQGNINADPVFEPGTFELQNGSPCIGAGTTSAEADGETFFAPSLDFNGNPRPNPIDEFVDMGAIESEFESTVGIPVPADQNKIRIYPNPSSDHIILQLHKPGTYLVEIHTLNGQLIYNGAIDGSIHQIDMSRFSKGFYFVTARSKEFVRTEKIIKL